MFKCDNTAVTAAMKQYTVARTGLDTWFWMMDRCYNPRSKMYERYGARGVVVCEAWHDPLRFIVDMGERPHRMTLDRIDNNQGYEPGNCRWATRSDQQNNRSNTIHIEVDGVLRPLKEVSDARGMNYSVVYERYKRQGLRTPEELFAPVQSKVTGQGRTCGHPPLLYKGSPITARELASMAGCSVSQIRTRYRKGLRDEALLTGVDPETSPSLET